MMVLRRRGGGIRLKSVLVIGALVSLLSLLAGCDMFEGACASNDGMMESECYEGWTKSECDEFNDDNVNGGSWSFHGLSSCSAAGYTYWCEDPYGSGYWTASSHYCIY